MKKIKISHIARNRTRRKDSVALNKQSVSVVSRGMMKLSGSKPRINAIIPIEKVTNIIIGNNRAKEIRIIAKMMILLPIK